jgi:putative nucleotidyltransferase with HDIG domain
MNVQTKRPEPVRRKGVRSLTAGQAAIFAVALAVVLSLALLPVFPRPLQTHEGDTASRTWEAPRDFSFESQVLTDKQRAQAASAVPDVLVFSQDVQNEQSSKLQSLLRDIANVRDSAALTSSQKLNALKGTENLFAPNYESFILDMPDESWQKVSDEANRVLNEVLAGSVARGQENTIADQMPQLIDSSLSTDEAAVVSLLVKPLIVSNLVVDQTKTEQAKDAARAAIPPVTVSYTKNQVIVHSGDVIDSTAMEAMRAGGLLSQRLEWRSIAAVVVLSVIVAGLLGYYVYAFRNEDLAELRRLALMLVLTALAVLVAKLYMPLVLPDNDRHFLAYALPLATVPILLAAFVETQLAIVVAGVIAALVTFVVAYLPDVSASVAATPLDAVRTLGVYGFGGIVGALSVHKADRLNRYVLAGVLVALVSMAVLCAAWFLDVDRRAWDIPWMGLAAGINGLLSGVLSVGAFIILGLLFGITTRVQLMELAQLNQPLLRRLQDEAPGTFHHSIIVGNLAERAADLIGADALLVRVGCYYHDVGKLRRPGYFIENQMDGRNPHDKIDARRSARIISRHVEDGLELGRSHRLPRQVLEFIAQHHGTGQATYFYRKALEQGDKVDASQFSYPGPKPQSREAAIVMLADSSEAAVRSSGKERSPAEIDERVDEVIKERTREGQLDESDLTLREIAIIADSFKATLRGVYHPRLEYPAEPTMIETRFGQARKRRRSPLKALSAFSVAEDDDDLLDEEEKEEEEEEEQPTSS